MKIYGFSYQPKQGEYGMGGFEWCYKREDRDTQLAQRLPDFVGDEVEQWELDVTDGLNAHEISNEVLAAGL